MKTLELLSPAKDYETGIAAINHGADAVYIGASRFGAREKAPNSLSTIEKLASYAHLFNAKVYVTFNTIIFDNELSDAENLINDIYRTGADALIIQDFGILGMKLPPVPLYASTQMHNSTSEKINFLHAIGFKRVILPRELTIPEISEIKSKTKIDLEFFIHGALCVSYSGQCYMSQAITGRSANRGACAQPCRSSYDLIDGAGKVLVKDKHILSLKDLNLSDYIADLVKAGITSFKIEGRMKDIAYVKNITAYYHKLLNNFIVQNAEYKRSSSGTCVFEFEPDPNKSFNRGFTNHFIKGRGKNQSSMVTQKSIGEKIGKVDQITKQWFTIEGNLPVNNGDGLCYLDSNDKLTGIRVNRVEGNKIFPFGKFSEIKSGVEIFKNFDFEFNKTLSGDSATRLVDCIIKIIKSNNEIVFSISDNEGNEVNLNTDFKVEPPKNREKAKETLRNQLIKRGNSAFNVTDVIIGNDCSFFMPISSINAIRRMLFEKLADRRVANYKREEAAIPASNVPYPSRIIDYRGNVANHLSKELYLKHGVESLNKAFEISPPANADLMTTRYCIKFELGICPSKQDGKLTGELYLRENKKLYLLEFDCKSCLMKVKQVNKKQ